MIIVTQNELTLFPLVALKSEEVNNGVKTYITMFTIHGTVLMPEQLIGDRKFEGIEFL